MKNITKTKNGFTIIEVVLVLAIAGLIFLATFIALPNLWASQRDSARKENIMTFVTKLKNYQTNNNRGALPGAQSSAACTDGYVLGLSKVAAVNTQTDQQRLDAGNAVAASGDCIVADRQNRNNVNELSWAGFYRDYMTDSFEDPGGHNYNLYVVACEDSSSHINTGENCNNGEFTGLYGTNNINQGGQGWVDNTLYVATGATCDGDTAVKSLNSRNVAVVYKLERTGQFCYNS